MNRHATTWVVIADAGHSRILEALGSGKGLTLIAEERNELEKTSEIGTDRPGRSFESADTSRHGMEPRVDWHRQQKDAFARSLAERLRTLHEEHRFESLVIVAPPQFLGDLRAHLDATVARTVAAEVAKDLTQIPQHDLPDRLKEHVAC